MPASPAMRMSPGRELRLENHKRGRSIESGILRREKEDDLALFNEVQNKERENFLLQSNDNFDDILSTKSRFFSDYKLGISIPARGEGSDLLNGEGDKNDYDWLITPPETPLFRSLDDEAPPGNLASRGRPRSQPVSILRSPTMEKGYRNGRGSASPQRLSPSPRSGSSTLQSRSRPSSATHSSPPPTLWHTSPSRGLSPPPSKPTPSPSRRLSPPPSKPTATPSRRLSPPPSKSSPAPRSVTPTPRRRSTDSAGTAVPLRVRGTSPVTTSRGNSASPKIRAWQSNIPGFSSDAPPNLRTSVADRPASYVRGSSPVSRNGSKYGRQSISPTAPRSVSSSHSHERDRFSSHSKGSVASSGDDDVDSLQSIPISSSDQSAPGSLGVYPSYTAMSLSKKPTKKLSSSAPRRSFDLVRQTDRKTPQNMFRPLLSSVPSSTFYGNAGGHHHSLASRNSSITTSSNASSDQATSGAHDTEGSEQNQEDVTSDCVKGHYDEVFDMEQADALGGDIENKIVEDSLGGRHGEDDGPFRVSSPLGVAEETIQLDATTVIMLDRKHNRSYADGTLDIVVCSKCGLMIHSAEVVTEGDLQLCLECKSLELNPVINSPLKIVMVGENDAEGFAQSPEHESLEVLDRSASIPESLRVACTGEAATNHLEKVANVSQHAYGDSSLYLTKQLIYRGTDYQQLQHAGIGSSSQVDNSEYAGISLLLKESNSGKGHIVQSRSFTASSMSYDNFSYVRDSLNSMRSSIDHSSASLSSSVDMGYSRQAHRQSGGHKSDIENHRYEMPAKHKRSISSMSGASAHTFQVPSITPSYHEDSFQVIAAHMDKEFMEETCRHPHEQSLASECTEVESNCASTASELSSHLMNVHSGDSSVLLSLDRASHDNGDDLINNSSNPMDAETSSAHSQTSIHEEDATPSSCVDRVDVVEVPKPGLDAISETEIENAGVASADSYLDELQHDDAKTATLEEFGISHPAHGILEESWILMEHTGETKARSLTLEEATDAILFCSSIVHNLAYEAANIAIDNETSPMEVLRPTIKSVGKPDPERRDTHSRTVRKRTSKSQKARQKKLETDTQPPSCNAETDEKSSPHIVRAPNNADSTNPPKLESKCNCIIM